MSAPRPQALCQCQHVLAVHATGGGPCRLARGCDCTRFTEAPPLRLSRPGDWMSFHRKPRIDATAQHPTRDSR